MISNLSIYTKFEFLPPELKQEVHAYIDILIQKSELNKHKAISVFGSAKGKIRMSGDFDNPLDDFQEYM